MPVLSPQLQSHPARLRASVSHHLPGRCRSHFAGLQQFRMCQHAVPCLRSGCAKPGDKHAIDEALAPSNLSRVIQLIKKRAADQETRAIRSSGPPVSPTRRGDCGRLISSHPVQAVRSTVCLSRQSGEFPDDSTCLRRKAITAPMGDQP